MYLTFYTCINNFDGIDITIAHAKKKIDLHDVTIMFCTIYEANWSQFMFLIENLITINSIATKFIVV